jgi:hypothetical protein
MLDQFILIGLLASLTVFLFPAQAAAQAENKTRLVFEIKNFPTLKIPTDLQIPQIDINNDFTEDGQVKAAIVAVEPAEEKPAEDPDITRDPSGKTYMHEPALKSYLCPKLKDKCKTFIAILKAENGTHECTRDNKGLNKNGSIDVGLAQINWNKKSPYSQDQLKDCKFNLDIALKKYETRGFRPWVAYNTGAYKKHLKYID